MPPAEPPTTITLGIEGKVREGRQCVYRVCRGERKTAASGMRD
jgi:hypothetical protein